MNCRLHSLAMAIVTTSPTAAIPLAPPAHCPFEKD